MIRKVGIGVIAAAFLLSGALMGVSYGGDGRLAEPELIELHIDVCQRPHFYLLRNDTKIAGQVTLCRSPIFDADGERTGTQNVSCTVSDATSWICTNLYALKAGSYTERGTIVSTGHYVDGRDDEFAITGGTGAYQDVGGYAVQGVRGEGPGVDHTLHLIP
jgi:hypothetical protein